YKNSDISVRQEIILSLGKIKDPKAIPLLIESLNDKESEIRWRSAMVLGWFGDQNVAPILRSQLDLETDDLVKENLKESLSKLDRL
ncbi:MAG: HEAT repeat domain-containing protein, partial [Candidatus Poribacteria bacterium]